MNATSPATSIAPDQLNKPLYLNNDDSVTESVRAILFGYLVRLARPVQENYHSDLYHDAMWITSNVTDATEFEFVVRQNGTHIGTDAASLFRAAGDPTAIAYTLKLTRVRHAWYLTISHTPA